MTKDSLNDCAHGGNKWARSQARWKSGLHTDRLRRFTCAWNANARMLQRLRGFWLLAPMFTACATTVCRAANTQSAFFQIANWFTTQQASEACTPRRTGAPAGVVMWLRKDLSA